MALTLTNQGVYVAPGFPFQVYRLEITLDGSATSGALQSGLPSGRYPLYFQNVLGILDTAAASPSVVTVTKVIKNATSPNTALDITVSGAGTSLEKVNIFAVYASQV
jgi:hypothetical protein